MILLLLLFFVHIPLDKRWSRFSRSSQRRFCCTCVVQRCAITRNGCAVSATHPSFRKPRFI